MDSAVDNRPSRGAGRWPNRRRTRRFLALGVLLAGALAFAWLVWPTPYRYGRDLDRLRVNRITGKAQVYDQRKEEWRAARGGRGSGEGTSGSRPGGGGGGSPIGGSRNPGSGRGGDQWWHKDSPSRDRKQSRGDQWWYQEGRKSSRDPDESPIGGSREPAEKGSPIGGQ